jgi:hypothetical protein
LAPNCRVICTLELGFNMPLAGCTCPKKEYID